MNADSEQERRHLLEIISRWPEQERIRFARQVLETVERTISRPKIKDTASRAAGLVRGVGTPPDDAEVKRILDEHRMEKYGK